MFTSLGNCRKPDSGQGGKHVVIKSCLRAALREQHIYVLHLAQADRGLYVRQLVIAAHAFEPDALSRGGTVTHAEMLERIHPFRPQAV